MNSIWHPGVALMNRLRYPRKFALISMLFILPLALVLTLLFQDMNTRIVFARVERVGVQYLRPLRLLLDHTLQAAPLNPAPDRQQRQIDQDLQELAAIDQRYGDQLRTTAIFGKL